MKKIYLLLLLLIPWPLFCANINVPSLEIYTRGSMHDGKFGFESRGGLDLLIEGGYKFGGRVVLDFLSDSLETETSSPSTSFNFKSASLIFKNIFGLPFNFSYFIGENSTFGSGSIFPEYFATERITTDYKGYLHFPDTIPYDGIHTINGTGIRIDMATELDSFLLSLFLYQDSKIDTDDDPDTFNHGYYSSDIRTAFNFKNIKIEVFAGGTFPAPDSSIGYYRGGLLFYAADKGVEFITQLGIPRWAPLDDTFGIDLFYLLFEPRVCLGLVSIVPTFFWRPAFYSQQETGEQAFDINLKIQIGKPALTPICGGIESNVVYQTESGGTEMSDLFVKVTPFIQFTTSGVIWEVRVNTNLWPFSTSDLLDCFLIVKAEF